MCIDFEDFKVLNEECKSGNPLAFSFLMDKYHQQLCTYAYSICGDRDVAKDVVQEVFFNLWEKRQRLNVEFSFKNFLYKSVYYSYINHYRKVSRFTNLEKIKIEAIDEIVHADKETLFRQQIAIVKEEINKLPEKCKNVFILSKLEGLSHNEISKYLNISPKTIENHINKAFKILRGKLKNEDTLIFILTFLKMSNDFIEGKDTIFSKHLVN